MRGKRKTRPQIDEKARHGGRTRQSQTESKTVHGPRLTLVCACLCCFFSTHSTSRVHSILSWDLPDSHPQENWPSSGVNNTSTTKFHTKQGIILKRCFNQTRKKGLSASSQEAPEQKGGTRACSL